MTVVVSNIVDVCTKTFFFHFIIVYYSVRVFGGLIRVFYSFTTTNNFIISLIPYHSSLSFPFLPLPLFSYILPIISLLIFPLSSIPSFITLRPATVFHSSFTIHLVIFLAPITTVALAVVTLVQKPLLFLILSLSDIFSFSNSSLLQPTLNPPQPLYLSTTSLPFLLSSPFHIPLFQTISF